MQLRLLLLVVALTVVCLAHYRRTGENRRRKEGLKRRQSVKEERFSVGVFRKKCQIYVDMVNALKSKLQRLQSRKSGQRKKTFWWDSWRKGEHKDSLEKALQVLSKCRATTPKPTTIALPKSTTSKKTLLLSFLQLLAGFFQTTTAPTPTTAAPKPSTAAPKPTTGASQPTTGAPKPTPAPLNSTTAALKSTAASTLTNTASTLTNTASKLTKTASKPTKTASKPTTTASQPTTATRKPTSSAPKPTTAAHIPTTAALKPTTAALKPTTAAPKPTPTASEPTTAAPRPTAAASKPTTATPKPTTGAPKPTPAASKPTTPAPKPTTAATKPTTAAPGTTTTAVKSSCDEEKMVEASISLIKWEMFTDSISNGLPCFPDKSACKADVDICIGYQAGRRTCDLVNFRSEIISNGREIAFNDRIPSWTPVFPDLENPIRIEFDKTRSINMFVSLYNYDDNPVVFTIDRFDFDMPDQTIIFHKERMVTLNGTRTADKTKLHLGITYGCKVAPIVSATQL